jgi:glycosyltransferase involved in cell wall biosynthesis
LSTTPRVTIGIPVYNGAATLGPAVEPLLAQTFGDFELVISDNASTDSTRDVVESLARTDPRIRYIRQQENIGANRNYSFVATAARGEFLKWASASDWCAPTFLEQCVAALDRDPAAVLAAPRTRLFEGDPASASDYDEDIALLQASAIERFIALTEQIRLNNAMNGLIRLSALRNTSIMEAYPSADVVMMGHLALLGKFILLDEPLFYRRMEAATSTALQDAASIQRHHYPNMTFRALFPHWKRQVGWFRAVGGAPTGLPDKVRAWAWTTRMAYWERKSLLEDIGDAWGYLSHRTA